MVVTNSGQSDWSTQVWSALSVCLRLTQKGDGSYVVEARNSGSADWQFIRICFLHGAVSSESVHMGVFACTPTENKGCVVQFHNYEVADGVVFTHNATD